MKNNSYNDLDKKPKRLKLEKDINRVDSLNKMTFELYRENVKLAEKYNIEAYKLAKKLDYRKGIADSELNLGHINTFVSKYEDGLAVLNNALKKYKSLGLFEQEIDCLLAIGELLRNTGELKKSLVFFKKSLKLSTKNNLINRQGDSLLNIGIIQSNSGSYETSILNLNKALHYFKAANNISGRSSVYNNLGIIYSLRYENYLALEFHYKSLDIEKELENKNGIARSLFNIGNIYTIQNNLDKALEYFNESYIIFKKLKNIKNSITVLSEIADIQYRKKQLKTAVKSYERSLKQARKIKFNLAIGNCLTGLNEIFINLKEYEIALKHSKEALELFTEMGDKGGICFAYLGMGHSLFKMNENNLAIENLKKSEIIAEKLDLSGAKKNIYNILSEIYAENKDYENAYQNHVKYKEVNDKLFNESNVQKITELETEYKFREEKNLAKIKEIELSEKIEKKEKRILKSDIQKIIIEQKLLRSQMTPHFIFNSLAVLHGMILNNKQKDAISYLSKFSKLLRYNLEKSREKLVSIEDELLTLQNYINLRNIGKKNQIVFQLNIDDSISRKKLFIPPMILQPLIENAIEHGFKNNQSEKIISLELKYKENQLICLIKDNGIGFKEKNLSKEKKSLSSIITKERLSILSKEFQVKTFFSIKNREIFNEKGTLVTISLPYKQNNK